MIRNEASPISIHALREESDFPYTAALGNVYISIHALREESDFAKTRQLGERTEFQSTLSVRRATTHLADVTDYIKISIHALREESDMDGSVMICPFKYFNPRSP